MNFDNYFKLFEQEKNLSLESQKWIKFYIGGNWKEGLNSKIEKELEQFNNGESYVLYKGMSWSKESFLKRRKELSNQYPFNKGQKLNLNNSYPMSWTKDIKIAKEWAYGRLSGYFEFRNPNDNFWIIFKTILKPEQVLLAIQTLPRNIYNKINDYKGSKEVISKKGKIDCLIYKMGKGNEEVKTGWPEEIPA